MTDPTNTGPCAIDAGTRRRIGRCWALAPVVLFGVQGVVLTVTIVLATGRGLDAAEPDYYARSLKWDERAALLRGADRLGWTIEARIGPPRGMPSNRDVSVRVLDEHGAPLAGARVGVELFHQAYAGERRELSLTGDDGAYSAVAPIRRPGLWELRILVERAGERCLSIEQVEVGG